MSILEVHDVSIRYITGDFKDIGLKEYVMRRLTGNYRVTEFWADHHITFSLEKGDMLGIIGTNGAGKSTLLKAVSGIMEPTGGYVKREGSIAALLELGSGFDGELTVRENTYLRGAMLGYTRKFMDEKYPEIIEFAELRDFQDRPFKQLSSGMMARLAFSVASLVRPDILILDEVLSVGDGAFRRKSEAKMREIIDGGATTILVSHSVEQVREMSGKVLWIERGEQIGFGDTGLLCDLYQAYLDGTVSLDEAKARLEEAGLRPAPKGPGDPEAEEDPTVLEGGPLTAENAYETNGEAGMKEESVLDCLGARLRAYITRLDGVVFAGAFILAMLVHFYAFTHKFINHDDVQVLFGLDNHLIMGRWLLNTLRVLTGDFSSSWLNGLAGSFYLALACVLIRRLFRLRRLLPALLISVCLVAFPTVASTYAYMFCSSPYLFALAASVLGAVLIRREKLWGFALGAVSIALSMGCYQAYFPLTATLLAACLILDVCDDRWQGNWKAFFRTALSYVAALAAGMILYVGILQFLLAVTGMELIDYAGLSGMGQLTPAVLLRRLIYAYGTYVLFFLGKQFVVFYPGFYPFALLCAAVDIFAVAAYVVRGKLYRQKGMMFFLFLLLAAFPLSSALIYVMAEDWAVHLLMVYPLVITLILPGVCLDRLTLDRASMSKSAQRGRIGLALALICLELICGLECVLVTNRAYFSMDITYENVYAYYTKLTAKLELQEGYTPDSQVALIGWASMPNYAPKANMIGVLVGDEALNIYSIERLLSYYMASSYNYASPETKDAICRTEEFQAMPCYPSQGSIASIDGVIVVKFSDLT